MDITVALVQEFIDDDPSLWTLKQFSYEKVYELIENRDKIETEDELYEALMAVMYATRPEGYK